MTSLYANSLCIKLGRDSNVQNSFGLYVSSLILQLSSDMRHLGKHQNVTLYDKPPLAAPEPHLFELTHVRRDCNGIHGICTIACWFC